MKKGNVVQKKSYEFAVSIVKLCHFLVNEKREFVLSKQVLRSGTSIGANIEEAIGSQTRKEFYHKITISYKETRETHYWIRLLGETNYISEIQKVAILNKAEELLRIIGSIQKSTKKNII